MDVFDVLVISLTLCPLGNCSHFLFLSSTDFFQNQLFEKKKFRNTIRVLNSLDPDQARRSVGPDLGPNCLHSYHQTALVDRSVNKSTYFNHGPVK